MAFPPRLQVGSARHREGRNQARSTRSVCGVPGRASSPSVIDLGSRRVMGWAMADHMRAELVCEALKMAISGC